MLKKSTYEDAVLLSNAVPVLKVFKGSLHKPLRLVDIERKMGLSHQAVFRKTRILGSGGILVREGNHFRPDLGNVLVRKLLELASAKEREEFFVRYPGLKEPFKRLADFALDNKEVAYALLFGSYAAGKAVAKTSDIDVFIVMEDQAAAESVRKKLDDLFIHLEGGYFLNKYGFSPVYAAKRDVKEMVDDRKKFIQAVLEENVIIYGEENYFREMSSIVKNWSSWK